MAKKAGRKPSTPEAASEVKLERGAKTQAIRDYLNANREAKTKVVVEALKLQGIVVTPNLVSITKAKIGIKRAKNKAKQAVADKDVSAGMQTSKSAALDAALLLYKAARGQEVPKAKVTNSFLSLVEILS